MWRTLYPWQAIRWNAEGDGGAPPDGTNSENNDGHESGNPAGDSGEIRLTSAQLAERLERQSRTAIGKLLSDLGVEKVDDLKTTLQKAREREQAEMTEAQRLQAQLAEYQQKEQQWAQEKRAQALHLAVQTAATKLGIVDAEVALALIRGKVEFDDKGQPQGVEAALTELLKEKPYLKGQPAVTGGAPTNPPRNHSSVDDAFTAALYKGAGLKRG